jgi:RNA polymerase sigma-70 factor (ECF subfamily)
VKVAVPLAGTVTSKPPVESAVTVCWTLSLFITVIDAPGATVSGPLKAKPWIVIVSAAEGGALWLPDGIGDIVADAVADAGGDDVALFEELEQAAAPASARAVTATPNMREDLFMLWTRMRDRAGSAERKGAEKRVNGVITGTDAEVLDEAALRLLYAEHAGPVLAYLLKLTRDRARAEDLLQETMLRAWRKPSAFEPGRGSVRAWLCTVAHNLVVDDARSRSARPAETELTEFTEQRTEEGVDPYEAALRAWEFADALAALSAEHRAVVIEVYYRRSTVAEAARTLGIPPGTVKSRTFYALRALRLACQERGITP